jgi:nitronate monooxygenase
MTAAETLRAQMTLPLIVAPMFLVSTPDMALETCKQGVVGSFPALNQRTSAGFEQWLIQMNDTLQRFRADDPEAVISPYAVNLIAHKSNPRLQDDFNLCVKHQVPIVITSLGAVSSLVNAVHGYGGLVLHDITNIHHAHKAVDAGVDGLIVVAAGAGGHGGTMNPVVLVNEVRKFFDGIVVLAGGLTTGADILSAQVMGADFAYMGTRFINTTESAAQDGHKKMIGAADTSDIIYTSAVDGVPGNFLRQSLLDNGLDATGKKKGTMRFAMDLLKALLHHKDKAGLLRTLLHGDFKHAAMSVAFSSASGGAKAWKDIWSAGQGVGLIDDVVPVAELMEKLKQEYAAARQKIRDRGLVP